MPAPPDPLADERSRVIVFPPVIPVVGFLLGVALGRLQPAAAWIPELVRPGLRGLGAALLLGGGAGFVWMVRTMKRGGTPIHSAATPTALVEDGPFRWSRNPMYLFGSIAYAGLALILLEPWSLALLPVVLAITHHGVVLREEALLERQFGDRYLQYKSRVPRWL
jgi:protein-S-isoprenylcysteine O-methyltransferase Ste14